MSCVSFQFTSLCWIFQWHSSLDSSRSCVSSTLTAKILYSFDIQLNLLIFSTHASLTVARPLRLRKPWRHVLANFASKKSSYFLEIRGKGLQFYITEFTIKPNYSVCIFFHMCWISAQKFEFLISQGTAATHLRWGGQRCIGFVANFIRFSAVQKSVNIRQSYRKFKGGNFFETQCSFLKTKTNNSSFRFNFRNKNYTGCSYMWFSSTSKATGEKG